MTDRPIIFSAPMVRALLAGKKTQTRRLATSPLRRCEVGDRLYVRENWRVSPEACEGWHPDELRGWIDYQAGGSFEVDAPSFDDVERAAFLKGEDHDWDFMPSRYRPCIHMPRWASRLTLIVEAIKVEPLQAISESDAWAEAICSAVEDSEHSKFGDISLNDRRAIVRAIFGDGPTAYRWLWDSLHTKKGEQWEDNPDAVALTFRVVRGNIDQVAP